MDTRLLGRTNLVVSRLGIGLTEVGKEVGLDDEARAARLLNGALDAGITFLDTAACYGWSETWIGRAIAHRRNEYVLATKCGHVVGPDGLRTPSQDGAWTNETIAHSVERSLRLLKTDHVDLLLLHSCGMDVLQRGDVIRALQDAKSAGKTRCIGYSGDGEAAQWAVTSGQFDALETTYNLVCQEARDGLFGLLNATDVGLIAKRPIANGVWGAGALPLYCPPQDLQRARAMAAGGAIPGAPDNHIHLALGFVLAHDEVDTAIVGSAKLEHVQENVAWLDSGGRLAPSVVAELYRRFDAMH